MNIPEGLVYIPNFITPDEEKQYLNIIDSNEWDCSLKRRVQHYGIKYNYQSRDTSSNEIKPLPNWFEPIIDKLMATNLLDKIPNQVIINEYLPGQGISPHIDQSRIFGKQIVSISLGSPCVMIFNKRCNQNQMEIMANPLNEYSVLLERCSAVILDGESRYNWLHSIPARKTDSINGKRILRERRVSLTFRYYKTN
jgi:alkylated DNA repair dioxygenase AlkB